MANALTVPAIVGLERRWRHGERLDVPPPYSRRDGTCGA